MYENLIKKAKDASIYSYSPYSKFKVGAALLGMEGRAFYGTNIENASYGLTICAERVAIFKAISEGFKKIKAIALYCDVNNFDFAFPCGACRQVMAEFFDKDTEIIISINTGEYKIFKLHDLLPNYFKLS